jgi:sec-independent protein translocase protein TatC
VTDEVSSPVRGEMTLFEHLAELRDRLVRAVLALAAGAVVGYLVFPMLLDLLIQPYCSVAVEFRALEGECALIATRPLEPFSFRIKTAMVVGLFIGGPVIFYQLWRFITPGLTDRERRYALPFVALSQLMFALGIAFAWWVIPRGLAILLTIAGPQVQTLLQAGDYLSFLLTMMVAFGLVFELPLVLVFLSLLGIVTSSGLKRARPYAIVGAAILAAVVTPTTDPVTMLLMMGPLVLFYELSVLFARLVERRRRRAAAP